MQLYAITQKNYHFEAKYTANNYGDALKCRRCASDHKSKNYAMAEKQFMKCVGYKKLEINH